MSFYEILNDITRVRNVSIDEVHRCSENANVSGSIIISSLNIDVVFSTFDYFIEFS